MTTAVEISTKGRYYSTLPLTLMSVAMQTTKPNEVHLFDDNTDKDRTDLRNNEIYKDIFTLFTRLGITWFVHAGHQKGQVANHQDMLTKTTCDLVWRIDDDCSPSPNVLETLLKGFKLPKVGAVSCKIWKPSRQVNKLPDYPLNKLTKGISGLPAEWFDFDNIILDAEHLYSTFLFDRNVAIEAGGYPDFLSPVGHHEETIFSHRIFRAGYKLVIMPDATTWHFHNPEGGIRSYRNEQLWLDDERLYDELIEHEWGYNLKPEKYVYLNGGIGDHYSFKLILDDFANANPNTTLILSVSYPEVFEDVMDKYDIKIISNADAMVMYHDLRVYDVYKIMSEQGWTGSLEEAFRKIYLS